MCSYLHLQDLNLMSKIIAAMLAYVKLISVDAFPNKSQHLLAIAAAFNAFSMRFTYKIDWEI
jgi:hypothetical protein